MVETHAGPFLVVGSNPTLPSAYFEHSVCVGCQSGLGFTRKAQ
jgi:hypothetical protein